MILFTCSRIQTEYIPLLPDWTITSKNIFEDSGRISRTSDLIWFHDILDHKSTNARSLEHPLLRLPAVLTDLNPKRPFNKSAEFQRITWLSQLRYWQSTGGCISKNFKIFDPRSYLRWVNNNRSHHQIEDQLRNSDDVDHVVVHEEDKRSKVPQQVFVVVSSFENRIKEAWIELHVRPLLVGLTVGWKMSVAKEIGGFGGFLSITLNWRF